MGHFKLLYAGVTLTDGNQFNRTDSRDGSQLTDSLASNESRHHLDWLPVPGVTGLS